MSKENAKLMEKELTEKRKLTSDVKENIGLKVFINLILTIVVMCVFFILNHGSSPLIIIAIFLN